MCVDTLKKLRARDKRIEVRTCGIAPPLLHNTECLSSFRRWRKEHHTGLMEGCCDHGGMAASSIVEDRRVTRGLPCDRLWKDHMHAQPKLCSCC